MVYYNHATKKGCDKTILSQPFLFEDVYLANDYCITEAAWIQS